MLGQETKTDAIPGYDKTALRDHILAEMRAGSLRLLLAKLDLDIIGTPLKGGLIGTADALDWMADACALPLIDAVAAGTGVGGALHVREGWGLVQGRAI